MNFRKLLAFVLVFSLAAQPSGMRLGYAEGTKAEEVRIENNSEASDELGLDLDEAELDEYLFDPGSREQTLEEAASVAAEEAAATSKISGALAGAIAAGVAAIAAVVGTLGVMIYNGANNASEIKTLWTSDEGRLLSRLGKTISILFKGAKKVVEETKKEPTGIESYDNYLAGEGTLSGEGTTRVDHAEVYKEKQCIAKEEAERKAQELNSKKTKLNGKVTSVQSRIDALKEEHKGTLQDELDTVKATIENATSVEELEGVEGQLTTLEGKVAEAEVAQNEAERLAKEEAERKAQEEAKRETRCPLSIEAKDLIEKKNSALNTLNKLEDTCGLDTVGFKRELSAIDVWTLTTPEKLAQAEIKLNSIINRINGLCGKCSDIKSKKGYIEKNWQAAVSILDSSDASLRNAWGTLKYQHVTEGNLKERAEEYETIAGRVKAIINSNNKISKLTSKISKAIEDKKDAADFGVTHYSGELKATDKMERREDSLGQIIGKLDLLYDELQKNYSKKEIKAVNKAFEEFANSKAVRYFESEECSDDDKDDLYAPYEAVIKPLIDEKNKLIAAAKKNHSLNGVAENLEEPLATINRVDKVVANVQMANKIIDQNEEKDWFAEGYWSGLLKEATKSKVVSLDGMVLHEGNVATVLAELNQYVSDVTSLLSKINNGEIVNGFCKHTWKMPFGKTLSNDACDTLKGKVLAEVERLKKNLKEDHDVNAFVTALKTLYGNSQSYIDDATYLEFDANKAKTLIDEYEKYDWFDAERFRKELAEKKTYSLENLKNQRMAMKKFVAYLETNLNKKAIQAVNKFNNSPTIKYFESEKCLASDNEDRYEPYEELVKPLIAKKNEIIAAAKKNHSLNDVAEKLEEPLATINRVDKVVANIQKANKILDRNEDLLDKSSWRSFLKEATESEVVAEDSLDLHEGNVATVLAELNQYVSDVTSLLFEINNGEIVNGFCEHTWIMPLFGETLSNDACDTLKGKVLAEVERLKKNLKEDHDVNAFVTALKTLYGNSQSYIDDATYLEFDANAAEEIIKEADKLGLIDAEYFNNKLEEYKDYSLENLQTKRTAMKAFLNELKTIFSKEGIKAVGGLIHNISDSEPVRAFKLENRPLNEKEAVYADYEPYVSSLIKEKDEILAKAREAKNLADVEAELKKVLAKIEGIVQAEDKRQSALEKIEQLGNNKFFSKDHYEDRLKDIVAFLKTEKDVTKLNDRLAGLLSHFDSYYSEKNLKKLSSLDKDIHKIIADCGKYQASYVKSEQKKYDEKIEELKNMHNAGEAVVALENYKKELQIRLEGFERTCTNRPWLCDKQ